MTLCSYHNNTDMEILFHFSSSNLYGNLRALGETWHTVWEQSISLIPARVSQQHPPDVLRFLVDVISDGAKGHLFYVSQQISATNPDSLVKLSAGKGGDVIMRS